MVFVDGLGQAIVENGDWENEFVANIGDVTSIGFQALGSLSAKGMS